VFTSTSPGSTPEAIADASAGPPDAEEFEPEGFEPEEFEPNGKPWEPEVPDPNGKPEEPDEGVVVPVVGV
jgi:hypothetical protein